MIFTQDSFYKSRVWRNFRTLWIAEHMDQHDQVICARCGKPILKKYDLILHHKEELNDSNVNDPEVSLNPDKIEPLHFKCHNAEHERFGSSNYMNKEKKVFIVYGAPCSGKREWIHDNAIETDLIVDIDSIYQMISINDRFQKPKRLSSIVFQIRDSLFDSIKYRNGKWSNAFVITGGARSMDRERLAKRINADDLIFIDTPEEECLARAEAERPAEWIQYVKDWFNNYDEGKTKP